MKLCQGRFRLDIRNPEGAVRHWHRLPREMGGHHPWRHSRIRVDVTVSDMA